MAGAFRKAKQTFLNRVLSTIFVSGVSFLLGFIIGTLITLNPIAGAAIGLAGAIGSGVAYNVIPACRNADGVLGTLGASGLTALLFVGLGPFALIPAAIAGVAYNTPEISDQIAGKKSNTKITEEIQEIQQKNNSRLSPGVLEETPKPPAMDQKTKKQSRQI